MSNKNYIIRFNSSQAKDLHQLALFTDVMFDKMYRKLGKNVTDEDIIFYQKKFHEASVHIHDMLLEISEEFDIKSIVPKLEKF